MKEFLKDYLTFSQKEKRAVLYLVILLIIFLAVPFALPYFIKKEKIDFTQFQNEIAELKKSNQQKDYLKENETAENFFPQKTEINSIQLFPFNPNTATADDWKKLGVRERTAKTILNYISKGGNFFKKEDLKKIYGFSEEDYLRLEKFIVIDKKYEKRNERDEKKTEKTEFANYKQLATTNDKLKTSNISIDINTADSAEWTKLKGIGEKFASRIIKYRNLLGGFVSIKQVGEVYGMKEDLFKQIEPNLILKSVQVQRINLNQADWKQLAKHPYIRGEIASQIIGYRNFEGEFKSLEELKKLTIITNDSYQKILPYLTIND